MIKLNLNILQNMSWELSCEFWSLMESLRKIQSVIRPDVINWMIIMSSKLFDWTTRTLCESFDDWNTEIFSIFEVIKFYYIAIMLLQNHYWNGKFAFND